MKWWVCRNVSTFRVVVFVVPFESIKIFLPQFSYLAEFETFATDDKGWGWVAPILNDISKTFAATKKLFNIAWMCLLCNETNICAMLL